MEKTSRRKFIKKSSLSAFGGYFTLSSLGSLSGLLLPNIASAKPGGHLVMAHHCRATFVFEEEFQDIFGKEPVEIYLGGSGYASFTNLQDYVEYDIQQVFKKNTVAMEWEVNHCYAGNMPSWGTIAARGQVKKNSDNRSYIIFNSKGKDNLFPATAINVLFFEIEFPNLNTSIINKEPIIFNGDVTNLDLSRDITGDYRNSSNPSGLPTNLRNFDSSANFEPIGAHNLVNPVKFYQASNPDKLVATLIKSELTTQIHYGVDIILTDCKINRNNVDATFTITNLTDVEQSLSWYVGDSYDLSVFNVYSESDQLNNQNILKEGRVRLDSKSSVTLTVQAYNNNPNAKLGDKACLFCGAHSTPKDLNAFRTDFVSGFVVAEGVDFRRVAGR